MLFILWGITILIDIVPVGIGIVGTGVILLGLNAARALNHVPTRSGTTTLGILALVWGGLDLARSILHLPFELTLFAIFAILLIVQGVIVLARELLRIRKADIGNPVQPPNKKE